MHAEKVSLKWRFSLAPGLQIRDYATRQSSRTQCIATASAFPSELTHSSHGGLHNSWFTMAWPQMTFKYHGFRQRKHNVSGRDLPQISSLTYTQNGGASQQYPRSPMTFCSRRHKMLHTFRTTSSFLWFIMSNWTQLCSVISNKCINKRLWRCRHGNVCADVLDE